MSQNEDWNNKVDHPLQSWEWGEFREKTGIKVVRAGNVQVTIHPLPYTSWKIGYCPKAGMPDETQVAILKKIANENNCIMIKVEPKVEAKEVSSATMRQLQEWGFTKGRSLFTKYNFVLDVTKSEAELLAQMKQKTRYNIKVALKNGVSVEIDNSQTAFAKYLELTEETTRRQGFYAHGAEYHTKMWERLNAGITSNEIGMMNKGLTANLLVAKYRGEIITSWVLFKFGDTLYYPYGASTREHREVMANNLVMWEAIKIAKKWGCKYLDMWGALGQNPDPKDPWSGFHNFKSGYGARHVEYLGSYDLVIKPLLYRLYRLIEELRWAVLRITK